MSVEPLVEASGVQVEDGATGLVGREDGSSGKGEEASTWEVEDQAVLVEAVAIEAAVDDLHAGVNKVYGDVEHIYRPVFLDMMKIMLPEYIQLIGAQDDDA